MKGWLSTMKVPREFKDNIMSELNELDIDGTWKLRGNINVLKNYLLNNGVRTNSELFKNIESLLEVSNDLYIFLTNIKGNITAADFNKMARLFHTGGDVSAAIEEIISKEDTRMTDVVMSGLSMVLTYVGNTSYISSALENCETTVAANSITIYDRLWSLIHKYNTDRKSVV
jgi:hypothetical protein